MADENKWGSNLAFILAMIDLLLDWETFGDIHMYFIQMVVELFSFPI